PHNKNAISQQLLKELGNEILRRSDEVEFETWCFEGKRPGAAMGKGTRAVVIGSEVEGVFCAGADLKERKGMSEQETNSFLQLLRETLGTLSRLEIPTISAVSSIALGGGLELALATEFRIFTPSTLVGLPETRLGIIPGAGGAPRLKHLLGQTRAMDIILTGRRIRGDEAFRIGLCDRLCGPTLEDVQNNKIGDDVLRKSAMDGALEMAKQICEGGPATTVPLMQLMRSKRSVFTAESEAYEKVLKTQDRDEALRAFAEKRKPNLDKNLIWRTKIMRRAPYLLYRFLGAPISILEKATPLLRLDTGTISYGRRVDDVVKCSIIIADARNVGFRFRVISHWRSPGCPFRLRFLCGGGWIGEGFGSQDSSAELGHFFLVVVVRDGDVGDGDTASSTGFFVIFSAVTALFVLIVRIHHLPQVHVSPGPRIRISSYTPIATILPFLLDLFQPSLLATLDFLFILARCVPLQHLRVDLQERFPIREMLQDILGPVLVSQNEEGGSEGLGAVESPGPPVVGWVGGD
ncbi:MAG: hypothetical protein Q9177_006568, partial [Variospora cf. flavescens]